MRHRLLALATAGALVLSSLVLGTYAAQADDTDNTVVVQSDEGTAVESPAEDSTPAAQDEDSDTSLAEGEDADLPTAEAEDAETSAIEAEDASVVSVVPADDTVTTPTVESVVSNFTFTRTSDDNYTVSLDYSGTCSVDTYITELDAQGASPNGAYARYGEGPGHYSWDLVRNLANTRSINFSVYDNCGTDNQTIVLTETDPFPEFMVAPVSPDLGTISGTVIIPDGYTTAPGYGSMGMVVAYLIDSSSGTPTMSADNAALGNSVAPFDGATGAYTLQGLVPGQQYLVLVYSSSMHVSPSNDFLPTAHGGYAALSGPGGGIGAEALNWDVTRPDMGLVTAVAGDVPDVNITMAVGAKITGTVYMPDGTPATSGAVYCVSESDYNQGVSNDTYMKGQSTFVGIQTDGSYSCLVLPGTNYVVWANVDGYLTAWRGGYIGSTPKLPNAKVTVIPTQASGGTVSGQDITLVNGSSISGIFTFDPGLYGPWVRACALQNDGSYSDCVATSDIGDDGSYTVSGLVPGETYVVTGATGAFSANTHEAWYGGYVGVSPRLPNNPNVTPITAADNGENLPGINIVLTGTVTVTGSVLLPTAVSKIVFACPIYTQEGQQYYAASSTVNGWASSGPYGFDWACHFTEVSSAGTSYSIEIDPDVDYVLFAQVDGYTDTWHGGYIGDAGDVYSNPPETDRLLPSSAEIVQMSGTAGQTINNVDIVFGESQVIMTGPSGVTFDADGGTPATQVSLVEPGETTSLPSAPSKDGYRFLGWYTDKDGAGTQFTSNTVVTGDVTVYAYWEPAPEAEVVKEEAIAQTTGGLARLADGTDAYTLVTTLTSGEGDPMLGLAGNLSAVTPANVTALGFTDNGDGTYNVEVRASVPGNYEVRVLLDGVQVGSPIPVNFIGADIAEPVRVLGDQQAADGLGFLPGEKVDVVVHSDPINIGRRTADAQGRVPVTFEVPKDFDLGRHTVTFTGVTSGTATVTFSVATPTASSSQVKGETGGTVVTARNNASLLVLAGMLVVAGLTVQRLRTRTVKRG